MKAFSLIRPLRPLTCILLPLIYSLTVACSLSCIPTPSKSPWMWAEKFSTALEGIDWNWTEVPCFKTAQTAKGQWWLTMYKQAESKSGMGSFPEALKTLFLYSIVSSLLQLMEKLFKALDLVIPLRFENNWFGWTLFSWCLLFSLPIHFVLQIATPTFTPLACFCSL